MTFSYLKEHLPSATSEPIEAALLEAIRRRDLPQAEKLLDELKNGVITEEAVRLVMSTIALYENNGTPQPTLESLGLRVIGAGVEEPITRKGGSKLTYDSLETALHATYTSINKVVSYLIEQGILIENQDYTEHISKDGNRRRKHFTPEAVNTIKEIVTLLPARKVAGRQSRDFRLNQLEKAVEEYLNKR